MGANGSFFYFINLFFCRCFFCLWGSLFFFFLRAGLRVEYIYIILFYFLLDEELGDCLEWGVGLGYISFFSLCLYMLVYPILSCRHFTMYFLFLFFFLCRIHIYMYVCMYVLSILRGKKKNRLLCM